MSSQVSFVAGWTPWGVPCSVRTEDGIAISATSQGTSCQFTIKETKRGSQEAEETEAERIGSLVG